MKQGPVRTTTTVIDGIPGMGITKVHGPLITSP